METNRNPDEFYFGMINSQVKNGIHTKERNETFDKETLKLLKSQDKNYIQYQRSVNAKVDSRLPQQFLFFECGGNLCIILTALDQIFPFSLFNIFSLTIPKKFKHRKLKE